MTDTLGRTLGCTLFGLAESRSWFESISTTELYLTAGFALACTMFFSMAEGAMLACPVSRLEELFGEAKKPLLDGYLKRWNAMDMTVLIADVVSNVVLVTIGTLLMSEEFDLHGRAAGVTALALCLTLIIPFGEILPRTIGSHCAAGFLYRFLPLIDLMTSWLRPVVRLLEFIADKLSDLFGFREEESQAAANSIYDLAAMAEKEGSIAKTEKEMIENIFEFRDAEVPQIMTPRTNMVCLEDTATLDDAVKLIVSDQHSRIPVYSGNHDNIVGVIYAKDVFAHWSGAHDVPVGRLMRKPFFIPESKKVGELLKEMRANQVQLAIILDEYGGTTGLVSIEDILEVIVGDIADEYDLKEMPFRKIGADMAEVAATLHIGDFNRDMAVDLPESEHYDTLGGYLFNELGRIPKKLETFELSGLQYTVLDADERAVHRLRIRKLQPAAPAKNPSVN